MSQKICHWLNRTQNMLLPLQPPHTIRPALRTHTFHIDLVRRMPLVAAAHASVDRLLPLVVWPGVARAGNFGLHQYGAGLSQLFLCNALAFVFGFLHDGLPASALGGRAPLQQQAVRAQAGLLQAIPQAIQAAHRAAIGVYVVTVHVMAAGDQHHRRAFAEGVPDELRVDAPRTHRPDDARVGRVGHAAHASRIGSSIGAPVAGEGHYLVLRLFVQDGIQLGVDGLVGEMPHRDSAILALRRASAASGAGRRSHTRHLLLFPGDGAEGTHWRALAAHLAQVFVHDGGDGLDLQFGFVQQNGHVGSRRAGLGDALAHVLGAFSTSSDEDALGVRVHRSQLGGGFLQEPAGGFRQADHLPDGFRVEGWCRSHRQHQHVEFVRFQPVAGGVLDRQPQVAGFRILNDLSRQTAHITHAVALAAHQQFFEAFAKGAQVHVEDGRFDIRVIVFQILRGLDGVHAADVGTIRVARIRAVRAGADTLDESDALRLLQVAGPAQVSLQRSAGRDQPLEFHAGHHVGETRITVLVQRGGVIDIHPRRDDDGAHLQVQDLVLHIEIDALLVAGLDALPTGDRVLPQALVRVDDIRRRYRLRERNMDGLAAAQSHLEFVRDGNRADRGAVPARGTCVLIYVAGLLANARLEVAHVPGNIFDLAVCQHFDVGMSTDIHHFRTKYSYTTLDVRIDLVQLRHDAADGRFAFDQVDLVAAIRQIQCSLDARHASPYHQGCPRDRDLFLVLGIQPVRPRHRHLDDALGLARGRFTVIGRDPGTVLADVGHLQQVRVQPRPLDTVAEDWLI